MLDPNEFVLDDRNYVHAMGEDYENNKYLDFGKAISSSEFNIGNGLQIGKAVMIKPIDYDVWDKYTFFVTFKHDTCFDVRNTYGFGF